MTMRRPPARRTVVIAAATVIGLTVGVPAVSSAVAGSQATAGTGDETRADGASAPVTTVEATRGDLTESVEAVGTVSNGDPWPAPIASQGVVTRRHEKGTVVRPGETLIWVAGRPVTLARGETPMYRELSLTRDRDNKRLQGEDVTQLQTFLLDAGFDDKGRLTADGEFGVSTRRAVLDWQKANGLDRTGAVDRSQLVFHPTALRIADEPRVGAEFTELMVGSPDQHVTASLDTKHLGFVDVGTEVELDLGADETVTGRITEAETAVGDDGIRKVRVRITPETTIAPGVERVTVTATRTAAADATIIPVLAILALGGGGYGVEIVADGTGDGTAGGATELRPIELLSVADDLAAVTGDVEPGDRLAVPAAIGGGE